MLSANYPLQRFFDVVQCEFDRGMDKYGPWRELSDAVQKSAVKSECLEWEATSLKTGPDAIDREREELTHLANVCAKRWIELSMRQEAKPLPLTGCVCVQDECFPNGV